MGSEYFVGIDIGTTAVKAGALDSSGQLLDTYSSIYCAIIAYPLAADYHKRHKSNISLRMLLTLLKNDMFSLPESEKTQYQKRKFEGDKFNQVQGALKF